MRMIPSLSILAILTVLSFPPIGGALQAGEPPAILTGVDPGGMETFASRELQRYLQTLLGARPELSAAIEAGRTEGDAFALGFSRTHPLIARLEAAGEPIGTGGLGDEGYRLKTCADGGRKILVITAGSEQGLLYGVYGLLDEHYGMGFFLHGDVFPVDPVPQGLVDVDEIRRPAQKIRGVLPWTDFLQSPSTWSLRDYALVIDQLAKMRMNLLQIHNYMGAWMGGDINEPFLWFEIDGRRPFVFFDTASWAKNPQNRIRRWGQYGRSPDRFEFGGADLYGGHDFGSEAALHNNFLENRAVHRKAAALFQRVLDHAHRRGLKVVLGTDIDVLPLLFTTQPPLSWDDPRVIAARLDQVIADYPDLDYLQLFFGEGSGGDPARYVKAMKSAHEHLRTRGARMRLITGGWGHAMKSLAQAVKEVPPDVILSCLADYGSSAIDPLYGEAEGRETWATPWAECDNWNQTGLWYFQEHVAEIPESFSGMQKNRLAGETVLYWRNRDQDAYHLGQARSQWDWDPRGLPADGRPKETAHLKTGDDIYRLWAGKLFGADRAPALAAIRAKGPSGGMGGADSGGMDGFPGSVYPGIEEAEKQLASVHDLLPGAGDPELRERILHFAGRIAFSLHMKRANLKNRRLWPWEKLPGPLRDAVEAFQGRVTTITELGTFASIQKKGIGLHYGNVEREWRKDFPLQPPTAVAAKWSSDGARISWRDLARPDSAGFHVYRSESLEGPYECITARPVEGDSFCDRSTTGEKYYRVAAVSPTGLVSPFSQFARIRIGASDNIPPRVVVISPPGTAPAGQALGIEALVLDDRDYPETRAGLRYRPAGGAPSDPWSSVEMIRGLRSTFRAEIPARAIGSEGVAWYVEGSDGRLEATFPARGPSQPFLTLAEEVTGRGAPPQAPGSPRIESREGQACGGISWDPSPGAHRYLIYRGLRPDFQASYPSYLTYIASETTGFLDDDPVSGVFYYRIRAADRSGRESEASLPVGSARVALEAEDFTLADGRHREEDSYSGGATVELPAPGSWIGFRTGFPTSAGYAVYITLREEGVASLGLSIDGKEILRTGDLGIGVHLAGLVPVSLGEHEVRLAVLSGSCFADRIDFFGLPGDGGPRLALWPVALDLRTARKTGDALKARLEVLDLGGGPVTAGVLPGETLKPECLGERGVLDLKFDTKGLGYGKTFKDLLIILVDGKTLAGIPVTLETIRDPALPDLWPPHQRVKVERPIPAGGSGAVRIRISNRGGEMLEFALVPGAPEVRGAPPSGRLAPGEAREIEVILSPKGEGAGNPSSVRVEIRAGDQTAIADVDYRRERERRSEELLTDIHDDLVVSHRQGWGELRMNRSVMDLPLTIAGKEYAGGLGTHAASETIYDISEGFRRFRALAGVDDGARPGGAPEIILRIFLDRGNGWEKTFESPRLKLGDRPAEIDIDLSGAKRMKIEGDPAGDYHWDHIDIVEPKLVR